MQQSSNPPNLKADPGFIFESGKTYTHAIGLSVAFRQWRADSHCKYLHGYSLQVSLTFRSQELDERNWVVDFGSLKSLKGFLEDLLDHKTLVAEDDPALPLFKDMDQEKPEKPRIIQLRVVPQCGMEALSYYIFQAADSWLKDNGYSPRCILQEVEVKEHESNWARYKREDSFYG